MFELLLALLAFIAVTSIAVMVDCVEDLRE